MHAPAAPAQPHSDTQRQSRRAPGWVASHALGGAAAAVAVLLKPVQRPLLAESGTYAGSQSWVRAPTLVVHCAPSEAKVASIAEALS